MAWKRGTQNNQAGPIRKGHIREFLQPSSRDISISKKLKIIDCCSFSPDLCLVFTSSPIAWINIHSLTDPFKDFISVDTGVLYLHAHEHPNCVLTCSFHNEVPVGSIVLSEIQRSNSKVCTGEFELWTVYQGENFSYDARESAIGDTTLRKKGAPPKLQILTLDVRCRFPNDNQLTIDASYLRSKLDKYFFACIVSLEENFCIQISDMSGKSNDIVCVIRDVIPEKSEFNDDEDCDIELLDNYRGIVMADTSIYLHAAGDGDGAAGTLHLLNNIPLPEQPLLKNVIDVVTCDNEIFPIKRNLLRPCIALTSLVQAGRGKYTVDSLCAESRLAVAVSLDACTFDRVYLYLQHEFRGEPFLFDPLLASELKAAAITLQCKGLEDCCDKVLGSFQGRVRTNAFISYDEIIDRNRSAVELYCASAVARPSTAKGHVGTVEMLLMLSGMVFDVTHWISEHPGGSTIIPTQALNVDCTEFFEIYHASRQSFLYLKEFYVGELDPADYSRVPNMMRGAGDGGSRGGDGFTEQLSRVTGGWRLKHEEIAQRLSTVIFKSF